MSPIRVVLVDGRPVRRMRLEATLSKNARTMLLGAFDAMASSYASIDAVKPDAVLLGGELSSQTGFDRFQAFLKERGIPIVPVWFFPFHHMELMNADISEAERARFSTVPEGDTAFLIDTIETAIKRSTMRGAPYAEVIPGAARSAGMMAAERTSAFSSATPPDPGAATARVRAVGRTNCLIVIGSSTGGIEALHTVLSEFAEDCPPTLVVQHIRENFTAAFVQRANKLVRPQVVEAENNMILEKGTVYVAPGAAQHLEIDRAPGLVCRLREGPPISGHRPSVDALFDSAARQVGTRLRVIGVLLTGMGADGARGLLGIREAGGHTVAQDEETSVVYGMPRAAAELGAAVEVLPLNRIARAIAKDLASQ
ncbi:CheB methylesterase domain-containing protein [Mesobacterium pallidum]|uniref:CheB methylesterase domain-containing protein n=1 Tax=Mesobacterium pallidum TaxID=2872037 RepID=UPI001EE35202|nr:CheB methylesterase domain-containing protein [Mesobacterium pallidum]